MRLFQSRSLAKLSSIISILTAVVALVVAVQANHTAIEANRLIEEQNLAVRESLLQPPVVRFNRDPNPQFLGLADITECTRDASVYYMFRLLDYVEIVNDGERPTKLVRLQLTDTRSNSELLVRLIELNTGAWNWLQMPLTISELSKAELVAGGFYSANPPGSNCGESCFEASHESETRPLRWDFYFSNGTQLSYEKEIVLGPVSRSQTSVPACSDVHNGIFRDLPIIPTG